MEDFHLLATKHLITSRNASVWLLTDKAVPSNQLQGQLVCQHRGVAMGDVGEGPGVDKHWCALQQLDRHMNKLEAFSKSQLAATQPSAPPRLPEKGLERSFMGQFQV